MASSITVAVMQLSALKLISSLAKSPVAVWLRILFRNSSHSGADDWANSCVVVTACCAKLNSASCSVPLTALASCGYRPPTEPRLTAFL